MRAIVRDLLRAGAQAGGRDHHLEPDVGLAFAVLAENGRLVVHQALDAADRRLLHDEVGERHFDVPGARVQVFGHFDQHLAERVDGDFALVPVQYLHESGHVRALEVVRQIHVHVEIRDRVLFAAGAILHLDRVIDVLDADLVDRNLTRVGMALHVLHGLHIRLLDGDGNVHFGFPAEAIKACMVPKPRIPIILDDSGALGAKRGRAGNQQAESAGEGCPNAREGRRRAANCAAGAKIGEIGLPAPCRPVHRARRHQTRRSTTYEASQARICARPPKRARRSQARCCSSRARILALSRPSTLG